MKPYVDATIAKDLLLQFQLYVKSISQRGPTDLTVYTENFSAKLMELVYGYPFINMNYASKNIAGIDLLNIENNHGIQITIQDNSSGKIINSIKKSADYEKLTVFFFNPNNVDTVVRHVKENGEWKDNVEVISLFDVFSLIEQDATKARQCKELCTLWINGDTANYTDLIDRVNKQSKKRVEANIRSKKYIPGIYIPEATLKSRCRYFADPYWAMQLLINRIPIYHMGYCYDLIKHCSLELKNGEKLSFENDCDVLSCLNSKNPELEISTIISKLENYIRFSENLRGQHKLFDQLGAMVSFNEEYANYNNSVSFAIRHELNQYRYAGKKYFFIVKDAGQGKTNFLCDFTSNLLEKRKIPAIYLNVNELTKNLLDEVCEQLCIGAAKEKIQALRLIEQYCRITRKYLVICIDGLNEKSNLAEFKKEVLELFRFVDQHEFIKVVATSRNTAYQAFFKEMKNESFGDLIVEDIEENQELYGRKTEEFKRKIYTRYRDYFHVNCYISSEAKTKLCNDTLLLRLFCEVYENNSDALINDIFLYDLFNCYIRKRGCQLFTAGRIKRQEDLMSLLYKIASKMIETHNLNQFTYEGFSESEKDLLDLVVQEDILVKSSDENGINLFGSKASFSFTYDEFRDYLLASVVLSLDDDAFEKEIKEVCNQAERYDGVLKFIFLFCKTSQNKRIEILKKYPVYNKIYIENIFSIEDRFLTGDDVLFIKKALENTKNKWVYFNVAKRLDVEQYKLISVKDIVDVYIEKFVNNPVWNTIFFEPTSSYEPEAGMLPKLLKVKFGDTQESEIYGILMLLCTITAISDMKDKYLNWLLGTHKETCEKSLKRIGETREELCDVAQEILSNWGHE